MAQAIMDLDLIMEEILILQWMRGDPDDAELFDFHLASMPNKRGQCYQTMSQIKALASKLNEALYDAVIQKIELSIGMPGSHVAGGFLSIQLENFKNEWQAAIFLCSVDEKKREGAGWHVSGKVQRDNLVAFSSQILQMASQNSEICELRFT